MNTNTKTQELEAWLESEEELIELSTKWYYAFVLREPEKQTDEKQTSS